MYDKTIAGNFMTFSVTATPTPTLFKDLLSAPDLERYNSIINSTDQDINGRNGEKSCVDGIISSSSIILLYDEADATPFPITADSRFHMPLYKWPDRVYVSISGGGLINVLLFIS